MNWTSRDKIVLPVFGALYLGIMILIAALRGWRVIEGTAGFLVALKHRLARCGHGKQKQYEVDG